MSEGIAFIGGVSIAGLAALVLLKGTGTPAQQPNFEMPTVEAPQTVQQPIPIQYPPNYGQQLTPDPNQALQLEKLSLNMQMEKLEADNQQLKLQNQQLQVQLESFTAQQQWNLAQQQNQEEVATVLPVEENSQWESPIIWAVGGAILTVCGGVVGVVTAGVLSLFSVQKQRQTRTIPRTVNVIHPYTHGQIPHTMRRTEFLPPPSRTEARRVETAEYDELY
ncbi:MAG: heterocyst differentiation related protein [Limnothrix sp. RL_2_0]|nr:heterocyst differentiation related protein [Limnothrix sp. RL_2_0]